MNCDYPNCVGGQSGTTCRPDCEPCHGPCQRGPCPTPDACVRPDEDKPRIPSLVVAIMLVLVIFVVLWVLS